MPGRSYLKILLACSRPLVWEDGRPVTFATQPGEEIKLIKSGLKGIKREILVTVHEAATLPEINTLLMNAEPAFDVLHFIGHGAKDGRLYLDNGCGTARLVKADELFRLIKGSVMLLVAMACFSEMLFPKSSKPAVPAVVCVRGEHPINARAAELFSGALYSGLARGKSLDVSFHEALDAVRMDDMVGEARIQGTKEKPTPWRRFVLKGDACLSFPDVPAGAVRIEGAVQPGPHRRTARTDELFIGRHKEIASIAQLLEPPRAGTGEHKARIITLCGEGGIGKTRLAQAAADWLAERGKFPGGIYEAACEGAAEARGLAIAILKGLGIDEAEGIPEPADALKALLRGKTERTLLLLDNLDALFEPEGGSGQPGMLLKDCLTASPSLSILVTCRWPLNLGSDERAFTLDPMILEDALELFILCIPDPEIQKELNKADDLRQMASLGLVLKLTAFMPLCVILAARRLMRHGESLETLLKSAATDMVKTMDDPELQHLPERLRSLRASLDLSYNRLSDAAKELFARMSFFPGGLFRKLDLWELLGEGWHDAAEELARYALARYDRDAQRYTMLHPVMEYARGKLEGDEFRKKAAEFWADFSRWQDLMLDVKPAVQEGVARALKLPDDPEERTQARKALRANAFAALSDEEANLTHAALWALGAGDEAGLGIVDSLEDYLRLRAGWYALEMLYQSALAMRRHLAEANPDEYLPDVAVTLNNLGNLHKNMGHPDEALAYYTESLGIYRGLSEEHPDAYMPDVAMTLNNLGALHQNMGHPDKALAYYTESLGIYRKLSEEHPDAYIPDVAMTLNNLGELLRNMGRLDEAETHLNESLEIRRKLSEEHPDAYMPDVAMTLNNLGALHYNMGHPDEALAHYTESLGIYRGFFQRYPSAYAHNYLGTLRNIMILHEKLGKGKELEQCRREMEEAIGAMSKLR